MRQAMAKAKAEGYDKFQDFDMKTWKYCDDTNYYAIIFDRDFLKAIWGEETQFLNFNVTHKHLGADCVLWEWHAKQMLVSEEPLKYLEKNLNRDHWKYIL